LSSGSFLQVSAATNASGQPVVFGLLTNHSLWMQNPAGAGLDFGWQLLSPATTIDFISAVTDASGNPVCYATAPLSNHSVWEFNPAFPYSWKMVYGGPIAQLSAGLNRAGQAEVFTLGFDGSLLQINPALNGAPVLLSPAGTILSIAAGRGPDTVFAIATW